MEATPTMLYQLQPELVIPRTKYVASLVTADLAAGTTVDYYLDIQMLRLTTTTKFLHRHLIWKIPSSWCGGFDLYHCRHLPAPTDGSAKKIVTLAENTRSAEPHSSTSSTSFAADVDRQMTYYTDSGEFHFEFGLDELWF